MLPFLSEILPIAKLYSQRERYLSTTCYILPCGKAAAEICEKRFFTKFRMTRRGLESNGARVALYVGKKKRPAWVVFCVSLTSSTLVRLWITYWGFGFA